MASLRRLAADHAALHKFELPPYYLFPSASAAAVADDLSQLNILLAGPPGTPYAHGVWRLNLRIPEDYPASPPKAFFRTKIWHPNVEQSNGSVCLDTLKRDWQPKLTLRDILITISCLLINPNPDSALNSAAGKLLQENWDDFARQAKLMTSIHARVPRNLECAVDAARGRGDELQESADQIEGPSPDEDMSDFEDDSKENDASMAPAEVRPSAVVRRPVLGKRPLAELPVPAEADESVQESKCSSKHNIAANTPNLSSHMASFSFKSGPAASSRPTPRHPASHAQDPFADAVWDAPSAAEPAAKRARATNEISSGFDFAVFVEPAPAASLSDLHLAPSATAGLALGLPGGQQAGAYAARKASTTAAGVSKSKPRVGLRRL